MTKFSLLLFLVLGGFSTGAFAQTTYGRWLCTTCTIESFQDNSRPGFGEVVTFLRSNLITSRWQPNETITVCDGKNCLDVQWRTTTWVPLGTARPDSRAKYKNGAYSGVVFSGGGVSGWLEVIGHWEWWDYYSDGKYIGSSTPEWIIDSVRWVGAGQTLPTRFVN